MDFFFCENVLCGGLLNARPGGWLRGAQALTELTEELRHEHIHVLLAAVDPALAARLTRAGLPGDGAHVTEAPLAEAMAAARALVVAAPGEPTAVLARPGPLDHDA